MIHSMASESVDCLLTVLVVTNYIVIKAAGLGGALDSIARAFWPPAVQRMLFGELTLQLAVQWSWLCT
jgi:hypothetical protein